MVDPDAAIRDGMQLLLDSFSIKVHAYADAQSFLQNAVAAANGCVLIENELPDLSGLELLKRLRERGNNVPVLLLTSANDEGLVRHALDQGALEVMRKPLQSKRMIERLQAVLGKTPRAC